MFNHQEKHKNLLPPMVLQVCRKAWFAFFGIYLFSNLIYTPLVADDEIDNYDITFDDALLGDLDKYAETHQQEKRIIPPDLIAIALKEIKEPLWNNTKAPAGRDILYLLPHKITAVEYGGFACNLFLNTTNRMKTTINSLFDLDDKLAHDRFEELISTFIGSTLQAWELEQLLPLFQKITVCEYKGGALLQGGFIKGPLTVQLNSSIQLGIRHFWLNGHDRNALTELLKDKFGTEGTFDIKELVKIKFGLGDTRFKIGLNTINATSFQMDIGFEAILPTSRASYTPKIKSMGSPSSLLETDSIQDSVVPMLRGVRDYIINPTLGIGHWGLGAYLETKAGLFHDLAQLWTRVSYDIFCEGNEDRLFMYKKTLSPSDLDNVKNDDAGKEILINYIRQYIFPTSFKTTTKPGDVVNIICAVSMDLPKKIRWAIGYDFYAQKKETIRELQNTSTLLNDLKVNETEAPFVSQHKIFTELLHTKESKYSNRAFGIGGDTTVSSKGIGQDWTIYFKFTSSF